MKSKLESINRLLEASELNPRDRDIRFIKKFIPMFQSMADELIRFGAAKEITSRQFEPREFEGVTIGIKCSGINSDTEKFLHFITGLWADRGFVITKPGYSTRGYDAQHFYNESLGVSILAAAGYDRTLTMILVIGEGNEPNY